MTDAIRVNSLAGFRRFLALPGATITLTRHDWADKGLHGFPKERVEAMYLPRTVAKLQTNAVKFAVPGDDRGSWLRWENRGKEFRFNDDDTVAVNLSKDGSFTECFTYKLSLATA